ncbi:MAG TPA: hypothetical protein VGK89_13675 [Candidatus Eisenbacteria bacterium]
MRRSTLNVTLAVALGIATAWASAGAQGMDTGRVNFRQRNLSGPRLGVTYVMGKNELSSDLDREGMGRAISQFGWHFERQIVPMGGGPQFVVQAVPMLGGVEYGKFIPGLTLAMGIRFPSGYEFGIGPNVTAVNPTETSSTARPALATAVGRSFNYGGVSLPLNLVLVTSPEGQRVSFIVGYAIQRTGFTIQ